MAAGDAERLDEVVQLAHEELDRPEVRAALGEVGAAPVAELVVVDDGAPLLGEVDEREQVVVARTRAAVEDDERRRHSGVVRTEVARDAVPRLGRLPAEIERRRALAHGLPHRAHRATLHPPQWRRGPGDATLARSAAQSSAGSKEGVR